MFKKEPGNSRIYLTICYNKIFILKEFIVTLEWGSRDGLWWWRRVGRFGLKKSEVGRKEQRAATALTEQNWQEDAGCAALIKGRGHPLKHGVHLNEGKCRDERVYI